ncbi:MAG TPA: 4-hydroxybenzoate octaprenyltransferase [Steroidobacteraceae bacterium]|jgi:4-hydroxybenzoate polyprenyltransferase
MAASVDTPPLGGGEQLAAARPRSFRRYGRRLADFARLMRLNRPIGIWLLMWPMLWALWIAAGGRPHGKVLLIFLLGVVVMRSAGCVVNDLADRNLDPFVRRTRERPLAARRISPYEALWLFAILIGLALYLVTRLDVLSVKLSFIGAGLAVSYPFFKRFFPLPQFYLGFAFGWAVPMAFAAQLGHVPRVGWVLLFITVLWAAIYDTIYAIADRPDDLKLGVKSSAILFADMDKLIIGAMQFLMLFALLLVGQGLRFGHWYYYGLAAAAAMFIYQQWLIRDRVPAACVRAFQNNNYVGMAIFVGVLLEYFVKR